MSEKEALARIKINKLLEEAGWRFFDTEKGKKNISLEHTTHIEDKDILLVIFCVDLHTRILQSEVIDETYFPPYSSIFLANI